MCYITVYFEFIYVLFSPKEYIFVMNVSDCSSNIERIWLVTRITYFKKLLDKFDNELNFDTFSRSPSNYDNDNDNDNLFASQWDIKICKSEI